MVALLWLIRKLLFEPVVVSIHACSRRTVCYKCKVGLKGLVVSVASALRSM